MRILETFLLEVVCVFLITISLQADPLNCDLSGYQAQPGLTATVVDEELMIIWEGEVDHVMRLIFAIENGAPVIRELAIQVSGNDWSTIASDILPEFEVVTGLRRVTQQQTEPLGELGIPLTADKLDEIKWDAFWDAPLYLDDEPPLSHGSSIPAAEAFANHPGMPRKPSEVRRSLANYHITKSEVRTNGARLEIIFPGVELGVFSGHLQFDVFKGSNLIRQMIVAKTNKPSVAFKYSGGLKNMKIDGSSRVVWRDLAKGEQDCSLGGPVQDKPVIVHSSNRLIAAELGGGSMAIFPPPHSFYWARESEQILGYSWYQKDQNSTFSLGLRQAEQEHDPEFIQNFALYNARPGTWQKMSLFIYISPASGINAIDGALAFTHGDRFKPLPGYKVMGHHYHVGLLKRLDDLGGLDQRLNDVETMKGIGVNIYGVIDGVRGKGRHDRGELYLEELHQYYEAARRQSDKDFLLMPSDENSTGGRPPFLGGHYDIIPSKPLYWRPARNPDQPLFEPHAKYGKVYNLGTPADMMAMTELEDVLISMPHPRAKRSTGYPDAIKDEPHFLHENYFGLGYRWGMGIDASASRLGEYRFLSLWDEVNNWVAARGRPLKHALAISEIRSDLGHRGKPPYDDTYGMSPVNYLKMDEVPSVDDMSPIINALKKGDYFVTSGEVLIPSFELAGDGNDRVIKAEVEWTFPLDFLEIVWGDGDRTDRQIISTTDLMPFGKKEFSIPFNVEGKKWLRFAAWDVATNGAMVQPVSLP